MSISVDFASFKKGFPKAVPVPARLVELGKWLKGIPENSLGYFDGIASEPLDVTYTDNEKATEVLRQSLGIFLMLPDGSRLALWGHGGKEPAVVLLGSEGELKNIAPDLDSFLVAWSKGKAGVSDLDEDDDDVESSRPLLTKWLTEKTVNAKANATAKIPPFKKWFADTVAANTSATAKKKEAEEAHEALKNADRIDVDLASVRKAAPKEIALTGRFEKVAKWLAKQPEGGLTESEVRIGASPNPLSNDDVVNAELRKNLVVFMIVRDIVNDDTVEIALWNHGGDAPAVVIRDEKEKWKTVAPDLDTFLLAWSRGKTGIPELDDGADNATRAELAAWLDREGAKAKTAKAPDVAAWIQKVTTAAKAKRPPSKNLGGPKKPPTDMAERAAALLGKPKDDPAVVAFCEDLGIDIASETSDAVLNRFFVTKHGYSFSFRVPEASKNKEGAQRLFIGVRFHRAKHKWWSYALGRDASFSEFQGPLPRGLTFAMSKEQVVAALGKPTSDDGDLTWKQKHLTLGVDFADQWDKIPAGEIKCVWLALK